MSQSQLLIHTIQALEKTDSGYMLTGSLVSSMQGEPRATHDIDIVVEISPDDVEALLAEFPPNDYYYDLGTAKEAIEAGGMFNILSIASGDKVDIWLLTDSAFDQSRFLRRQSVDLLGLSMKISSPEDTILMKLLWAKNSGGSEKQYYDAAKVYEMQEAVLDHEYLDAWNTRLGLEKEFDGMRRFIDNE
jgi:hypothetical protein